jgi:hypothetical protein
MELGKVREVRQLFEAELAAQRRAAKVCAAHNKQ